MNFMKRNKKKVTTERHQLAPQEEHEDLCPPFVPQSVEPSQRGVGVALCVYSCWCWTSSLLTLAERDQQVREFSSTLMFHGHFRVSDSTNSFTVFLHSGPAGSNKTNPLRTSDVSQGSGSPHQAKGSRGRGNILNLTRKCRLVSLCELMWLRKSQRHVLLCCFLWRAGGHQQQNKHQQNLPILSCCQPDITLQHSTYTKLNVKCVPTISLLILCRNALWGHIGIRCEQPPSSGLWPAGLTLMSLNYFCIYWIVL